LNYISLASPHLGIACLQTWWSKFGTSLWFCRGTASDLLLEDHPTLPLLLQMTLIDSPYFLALQSFKTRITYASCSIKEWKVPYATSAMVPWMWGYKENQNETSCIINVHEDLQGQIPVAPEDILSQCYFKGEDKDKVVETMMNNLHQLSWTRVDVNLLHGQVAVINTKRSDIMDHIKQHILCSYPTFTLKSPL